MKARDFFVMHTLGAEPVRAASAAQAVRQCHVPGGYRQVLAVAEAAFLATWDSTRPRRHNAPFLALLWKPEADSSGCRQPGIPTHAEAMEGTP